MLTLETSNLHEIATSHGLSEDEIHAETSKIQDFLDKIHAHKQGFCEILDHPLDKIHDFAQKARGKYTHIVVCGIGGSALGAAALQQSLKHLFENELPNSNCPRLHILDNIDPSLLAQIDDIIDYDKTLFIIITKSGTTTETMSQYKYFRAQIESKTLDPKVHFVFITDPEKGELREIAKKDDIPTFDIPENVGGRFSVLTPAGLLPAALIEIDINRVIAGAKSMRGRFLKADDNPAFTLATIQYLLSQKGKNITVVMPYSQRLIRLADWYRQLLAESIGKSAEVGLTPVSALGVTDQHSQLQLYNDGPNDKLIIFIEVERHEHELKIPDSVTFNQLMQVEKRATEEALTKNNRPNITIKINSVSEESLGELLMLFEGSIAFLGEFYGINAFDQPGVELSKKLTKQYVQELS